MQAADGYFRILGRVDDVINVAGHRLGTEELESAALTVDEVAEAAAVPVVDELHGRAVEMYISLKPGAAAGPTVAARVGAAIETEIGKVARPKNVWIVRTCPRRSGKIMRRVIAGVSNFTDVGDVGTLANPEIVDEIRRSVQGEKAARGASPALPGGAEGDRRLRACRVGRADRPAGRARPAAGAGGRARGRRGRRAAGPRAEAGCERGGSLGGGWRPSDGLSFLHSEHGETILLLETGSTL